ncbi:MAG: YigZ family protein [Lachnospiraceae bacterium]|nr:YigZ family protein [uncultured Acetatifactor sp.]MCI8286189.1 YigZ family protein [Lachnospiraceae bacterium]
MREERKREKLPGDSYCVLLEGGQGEYVEKKSRFIATLRSCESEEEALRFIEEMKKKYWDARHNCHAFIVGERGEMNRCSDDGEPGGTAGRPMLEVLTGAELRNVAAVVTRYFGGVLLGTGGLVRAYTQAVKEGLKNCRLGRMRPGQEMEVTTDYNGVGKILYLLGSAGIEPDAADYGENVVLRLTVPAEEADALRGKMTDMTGGRVKFDKIREIYFVDKEAFQG